MGEDKALRRAQARLIKALEDERSLEAIELLTELRRLEPENARWPHKQGELLRLLGHQAHAAKCFEKAVGLYAKQGFIARAVAMAKTVVELDPSRIGILERIDPHAAQMLRTQKKLSRQALVELDDRPVEQLPLAPTREPHMRPGPAAPPPPPARAKEIHAQRFLGSSMPPRAAPAVPQHPAVPQRPLVSQHPAVPQRPFVAQQPAMPQRPTGSQPAGVSQRPTGPKPPPPRAAVSRAPQRSAPPKPPAAAMQVQAATPAITLDRLSLPPFIRNPRVPAPLKVPTISLDDIYGRAVRAVPLLAPDERSPQDETRFSSIPEARTPRDLAADLLASPRGPVPDEQEVAAALAGLEADEALAGDLALSEAELAERVAVPVLESARPAPPTAARLADLPLFPLFAALPPAVLARIVSGSTLISLAHSAYVVRQHDDGDALFGIVEGSVSLSVPGQAFELTLAEGDVFGESCLLEEAKSQLDVLVMGQLTALRIPRRVLLQGIEEHPPLAGLVLALLTRRLLGNLLQVSPLFQDFDAAGKSELARLFEVRRVAAGTELSVRGKKMDGLYISLTGTLSVDRAYAAGPGSMFGQSCLLSHTPSEVDVATAVDMIVLRLPAARFAGLALQYPTVLARLAELSTGDVVRVML
jgi:CRP-like cAMP-binding protein